MQKALKFLARFSRDESGATMVEYGLMIALIAVALIVVVTAFGIGAESLFRAGDDAIINALS